MSSVAPFDRKLVLLSTVFLVLIICLAGGMALYTLSDRGISDAYVLAEAAHTISQHYCDDVSQANLFASARNAIFEGLDRYSDYVDERQFSRLGEELSGHYGGIGVMVVRDENGLLVMSVREGGPADQAGFVTGDVIVAADSVDFSHIDADSATSLLRGEEGSPVLVRLFRPVSADTIEITVVRQRIPLIHVAYAGYTPDSLIYIRLLDFEAGTTDDVRSALDSLLPKGGGSLRGVILDLSGNPGGLFSEACDLADLFLEDGTYIVSTAGRSRWRDTETRATSGDILNGAPLALIIDRGSASSAEIVAGALQQAGRAALIGDTTFGKGLVQGYTRFPDGDGVRLTIARYHFDHDTYLNEFDSVLHDSGRGLAPDHYVSFEQGKPFLRAVENSPLLMDFVVANQEHLIRLLLVDTLADSWVDSLAALARREGALYKSRTTKAADWIAQLAASERATAPTLKLAEELLYLSQENDYGLFRQHSRSLKTRIKQVAFEREYGTYRAYRDVTVPESPFVQAATRILLAQR
ncbi:MAG TPA: S41 family peptidase [Candidatus Deferrimicrobium sp.]|nr:S41 family peptidase [Candidatus Deferrimicrobium sp.]